MTALADHLWQSTFVALIAAVVARALKNNPAQVRHRLWLGASVKFLVPFSVLTGLVSRMAWLRADAVARAHLPSLVGTMSEPFSRTAIRSISSEPAAAASGVAAFVIVAIWIVGTAAFLCGWFVRWRRVMTIMRRASPVAHGRELDILRRLETAVGASRPITLVSCETALQPAVFGVLHPVLLWPQPVGSSLDDQQTEAILAHELSHAIRRDNLTAVLHMLVEAIFWFHPLVWWIGVHLVDEREQACDEQVIRLGNDRQVYAESILRVCRSSLASPAAGVAGVGASHLAKRLERIMTSSARVPMTGWRARLLLSAAIVTIALPLAAAFVEPSSPFTDTSSSSPVVHDPSFATAAITRNTTGEAPSGQANRPGGFELRAVTLGRVIANAWHVRDFQISGAPDWFATDRFDIIATATGNPPMREKWLMVQTLLADYFKLRVHTESRDRTSYDLVMTRANGRPGPQLHRSPTSCNAPGAMPCGYLGITIFGELTARAASMDDLAGRGIGHILGAVVVDRTGLKGAFDADLEWKPVGATAGRTQGRPSFEDALREQLGLDLVRHQGAVEILVIDAVERPAR
jgi:bla regulator protein BlaR1